MYGRVMVKLSGKRTVSGQFPGKLPGSTEGAILRVKKNLSGNITGKCIGSMRSVHNPVFVLVQALITSHC